MLLLTHKKTTGTKNLILCTWNIAPVLDIAVLGAVGGTVAGFAATAAVLEISDIMLSFDNGKSSSIS